ARVASFGRSQIWWKLLMAMPQCAIAQEGSAWSTRSNCGLDSSYQKSWSRAMPRLTLPCTEGAQDTGNDTVPSRSTAAAGAGANLADGLAAPAALTTIASATIQPLTRPRVFIAQNPSR